MNTPAVPSGGGQTEDLEAQKLRSEVLLNRSNRLLKRVEARRLLAKPLWLEFTVPGATVIVAVVGFLGTFAASYVKGWYDLELTRQKYDADLVLRAVVPDAKQSRDNLRFLLEAGLLNDPDGRVAKAVADPNLSIRLASQASADLQQDFSPRQMQTLVDELQRAMGTTVSIRLQVTQGIEPNAYALRTSEGVSAIVYTQGFIDTMRRRTGSNWAAYAIVAHEMAHIVLGHTAASNPASVKQLELHADEWAGSALARLGATLLEASVIYLAMPSVAGSSKFPSAEVPSAEERRAALEKGWRAAQEPKPTRK